MTVEERETALLVDRVAAAVEGVTRVFPAGPAAARAARKAVGSPGPLSGVRTTAAGLAVEVCVGIEGDAAAIGEEVARALRSALAEQEDRAGREDRKIRGTVEVRVRVSRVR